MKYTLGKSEKLKSRTAIQELFSKGKRINSYPLQLIYAPYIFKDTINLKVGFSVPKRTIKLAVNRNRIKRVMREVYRLNKHLFVDTFKTPTSIMLIYMLKEELKHEELEASLKNIFTKLKTKINEYEQT